MGRPASSFLSLLTIASLIVGVGVTRVAAQEGEPAEPVPSSSSTTVLPPTTATPSSSTTTAPAPTSTTPEAPPTSLYFPPLPPELAEDPRLPFLVDPGPGDGVDIPLAQNSFDPRSVMVLPELVDAAKASLLEAQLLLADLQQRLSEHAATAAELRAQLDELRGDVRAAVARAAAARRALSDHAVTAYMLGDVVERLELIPRDEVEDHNVAKHYVRAVVGTRERLLREYELANRELGRDEAVLARRLGDNESQLVGLTQQVTPAFELVVERSRAVQAYEAGAQAYIDGFVFPVAGEVEFIDSWGYPRMMGTPSAHWHQGTDIFAAHGTPLIAAENGTLARIGTGTLGGNKLWIRGESGNEYYYAHLSAFEPGIADGQPVRAGDVIGYVGDTGNARGTSPHLHFEIHPGGNGPVNPYPLLRAAYGNRPVARAVAPTTVPEPAAESTDAPVAAPPG